MGVCSRSAILYNASLYGVEASGNIISIGPIGSRNDTTIYLVSQDIVKCGCWKNYKGGSLEDFEEQVEETYPEDREKNLQLRNQYLNVIAYFKASRKQWIQNHCNEVGEHTMESKWQKYTEYLQNWVKDHKDLAFSGCSPACFNEWLNNEDKE